MGNCSSCVRTQDGDQGNKRSVAYKGSTKGRQCVFKCVRSTFENEPNNFTQVMEFLVKSEEKGLRSPFETLEGVKDNPALFRSLALKLSAGNSCSDQQKFDNEKTDDEKSGALALCLNKSQIQNVRLDMPKLSEEVLSNIRRWWTGEITGIRCGRNLADSGSDIIAWCAGNTVDNWFQFPDGSGISSGVKYICDSLNDKMFQIPKSEALDKAYSFLGVPMTASNGEINSRYRKLSRKYHADKGGDSQKWTELQCSLAIIRKARGDME
ncbi:hypothetical protein MAR_011715 [Mya arenaria]|uniref:J domain-containing protein n=1 Tax=Mya arenaria TaxID=6604 RepID=A0ABY7FYW6_MYAAR|nr:uncharacterized protein LOC128217713 isoform X2 [Mya arenaria]WAR26011.1 hypothetical protein MAR_011715 [Mya arenaria]